ncbi:MAG: glycosyltransferase [Candidatus Cryptobacteroides sp.]
MRVLWFANTPSNFSTEGSSYNGTGWVSALESEIRDKVELGLCFMTVKPLESLSSCEIHRSDKGRCCWLRARQHGVDYYPVHNAYDRRRSDRFKKLLGFSNGENDLVRCFTEVVEDFRPDVIQIFGSEHSYGLVAKHTDVPVILHLQGIMNPYFKSFFPPGVSWNSYIISPFSPSKIFQKLYLKKKWERACDREKTIFSAVKYYLGRTAWDRSEVLKYNPSAVFYHGDEILRRPFYDADINATVMPSTLKLVTTISEPTYKGYDVVLRAGKILKEVYGIEFEWKVYGNIDPRFFEKITGIRTSDAGITLAGVATADELVEAISGASMYVHPSYIDNSPNSLCEAQLLGAAVVATSVGGVPSLIEDGVTGFLVRSGNADDIAERVVAMYRDKTTLRRIGRQAREVALQRHNRDRIVADLLKTYSELVNR